MNIQDMRKKLVELESKRGQLKSAMEYYRSFSIEPDTAFETKGVPIMVVSEWFNCPVHIMSMLMDSVVMNLRDDCEDMAKELGVDHEELPLDD